VKIQVGDKVTAERRAYFDGTPVAGWPNPDYIARVLRFEQIHGADYAICKRERMAKPYRAMVDELTAIE
jgi:hypothetical protein